MIKNGYITLMCDSIRENSSLPAFSDYEGQPMTYGEVGEKMLELHQVFEKLGIKKGDKIALVGRNMSAWAVAYLAVISYGAVVVPILPDFSTNDIQHIVNHSESVLLFATELQYDKIDIHSMPHLKGILSLPDYQPLCDCKKILNKSKALKHVPFSSWKAPEIASEELMVLSYTSGTSGFSKGVMLPHRSIWSNVQFGVDNFDMKAGDPIVSFLPLAHAYGCLFEFLWPFVMGCHITFLNKTPSPRILTEAFETIKPKLILSVPLILEKIFKKRIQPQIEGVGLSTALKIPYVNKLIHSRIKSKLIAVFGGNFDQMIVGGAALNPDVEQFLRTIGFPLTVGYGMTECGPLISYTYYKNTRYKSAGQGVDRMQVRIDSDDPYNILGEIQVKGDNLMLGYYKNKEATQEIFTKDGWLRTGDMGIIDKDGFIYIKGRCKSMILGASGQNIYPEEIEAYLNNMDFVQESLVRDMGEGRIEALIYPDFEQADSHGIGEAELEKILQKIKVQANNELPAYMNISKVTLFNEEFEKTPKKSIKRYVYNVS